MADTSVRPRNTTEELIRRAFRSVLQSRGADDVNFTHARYLLNLERAELCLDLVFSERHFTDPLHYNVSIATDQLPRPFHVQPAVWHECEEIEIEQMRSLWSRCCEDHRMASYSRLRATMAQMLPQTEFSRLWENQADAFTTVASETVAGPEMTATEVNQRLAEYDRQITQQFLRDSTLAVAPPPASTLTVQALREAMDLLTRNQLQAMEGYFNWEHIARDMMAAAYDGGGKDVGTKQAQDRGMKLLRENLTPEQLESFEKHKHFVVVGGTTGRKYRIREGRQVNIDVLRDDGSVDHKLCFLPEGGLVTGDVMVAQKVTLECAEEEALKVANRW